MQIEHDVKVIPIDADHKKNVDGFVAQGWQLIPGMVPVGIYPVVRVKAPVQLEGAQEQQPSPGFGAIGTLSFDESKVGVMHPDGSVTWPDGSVTPAGTDTKQ